MPDTAQLRAALTHALAPHLPPELVSQAVEAAIALAPTHASNDFDAFAVVGAARAALPEPYASAAGLATIVLPIVRRWWRERVLEASEITVIDERAPD